MLRKQLHQVNSFDEVEGIFADYIARDLHLAPRDVASDAAVDAAIDAEMIESEHA
jgi:hypothetical protein